MKKMGKHFSKSFPLKYGTAYKWATVVGVILICVLALILFFKAPVFEPFEEDIPIDFYVITMGQENRLKNIEKQQANMKHPLVHIDAVVGDDLNLEEHDNILPDFKSEDSGRKRVIGCYMSHLKTYQKIKADGPKNGYSVILEDDFTILPEVDDIHAQLLEMIRDLEGNDFDVLYLENSSGNSGEEKKKGICLLEKDKPVYGTMAMMVKNKNIDKIIREIRYIKDPVDVTWSKAIQDKRLTAYTACPFLFNSRNEVSTISGFLVDPDAVFT